MATKAVTPSVPVGQAAGKPAGSFGGNTTGTAASTTPALSTAQQAASDLLKSTLTEWGLQSLLPHIQDYLTKGYDNTTINLYLQDTPEWKARFAGNEIRKQKGLGVLTPAQYIATEEQYRNVMQAYGLPAGFYDKHDDFNAFIGNDVSPAEMQTRAQIAHDTYFSAPQEFRDQWAKYGFSHGDGIAAILDPDVGTQVIQDRATQVQIGATAFQNGFTVDQQRAQQFQQHGTTLAAAQKAYSNIAQQHTVDQSIASRFGTTFGQTQEENAALLGDAAAQNKQQMLYSSEENLFKGSSGTNEAGLGVSQDH